MKQAHLTYCLNVGMTEEEAEEDWNLIQKGRNDMLDELMDPRIMNSFRKREKEQKDRWEKEKARLVTLRKTS